MSMLVWEQAEGCAAWYVNGCWLRNWVVRLLSDLLSSSLPWLTINWSWKKKLEYLRLFMMHYCCFALHFPEIPCQTKRVGGACIILSFGWLRFKAFDLSLTMVFFWKSGNTSLFSQEVVQVFKMFLPRWLKHAACYCKDRNQCCIGKLLHVLLKLSED